MVNELTTTLPKRDGRLSNEQQGLYEKYIVHRTDGSDAPGGKHHGCEHFVLDVTHDKHAAAALGAYANAVAATHPQLAADMRARWGPAAPQVDPVAYVLPHDLQRMRDLAVGSLPYNLPLYPKPVDGAVALHVGPVAIAAETRRCGYDYAAGCLLRGTSEEILATMTDSQVDFDCFDLGMLEALREWARQHPSTVVKGPVV